MARLVIAGAELRAYDALISDGLGNGVGTITIDTTTFNPGGGSASYKLDSGAGNAAPLMSHTFTAPTLNTNCYIRGYFYLPALPTVDTEIFYCWNGTAVAMTILLTATGVLQVLNGSSVQQGSNSASVTLNAWHRLEIRLLINSGTTDDQVQARLDGADFCNVSAVSLATVHISEVDWGWNTAPGASKVIYWDDIAVNDSSGTSQNTWLGAGAIRLLWPVSDSAIGSWLGGAGGATNLWDALNNAPPVGVATPGTNTSQIRTATNATTYTANCTSYSVSGIAAIDTINLVQSIVVHAEESATGSKTGTVGAVTNPTIAGTAVTFGGAVGGAAGTYPINWLTTRGTISYAPTPTLSTQPTVSVVSTTMGGAFGAVCFAGILVDSTAGVASSSNPQFRHLFPALGQSPSGLTGRRHPSQLGLR